MFAVRKSFVSGDTLYIIHREKNKSYLLKKLMNVGSLMPNNFIF